MSFVFASDIDNTLTGGPPAHLKSLSRKLTQLQNQKKLFLILSTGRRLDEVIDGFEKEYIPIPDAIITQVGTEIFLPPFNEKEKPLEDWDSLLKKNFSRSRAKQFIAKIPGLEMQPKKYNTHLKLSVYLDRTPNPEKSAKLIKDSVLKSGEDGYRVVWSSGRDLDIIPQAAGKANAIRYVIKLLKLRPRKIIVAGDSGNDSAMFKAFPYGIAVANAKTELVEYLEKSLKKHQHYLTKKPYAAGVQEGLMYFGII